MKLPVSLSLLILSMANALACPDCALQGTGGQIEPQTVTSKLAFSSSTLFLIGIVFTVLGFMVWMMVRTCMELAKERPLSPEIPRI